MSKSVVETGQMYADELKRIRSSILKETIPSVNGNRNAVLVASAWIDQMSLDIEIIEKLVSHMKFLEARLERD